MSGVNPDGLRVRRSARLLVLNADGDVLLFKFLTARLTPRMHAKGIPHFWATPGGGQDPGETIEETAARELFEETGWRIPIQGSGVLKREFKMQIETEWVWAVEDYFQVAAPNEPLSTKGFTELERETMPEHRWWSAGAIAASRELFFPQGLNGILRRLSASTAP